MIITTTFAHCFPAILILLTFSFGFILSLCLPRVSGVCLDLLSASCSGGCIRALPSASKLRDGAMFHNVTIPSPFQLFLVLICVTISLKLNFDTSIELISNKDIERFNLPEALPKPPGFMLLIMTPPLRFDMSSTPKEGNGSTVKCFAFSKSNYKNYLKVKMKKNV